jgi:glucosamine kinase
LFLSEPLKSDQNGTFAMAADLLLLGVDGGGTRCRARLTDLSGQTLGEAVTGPANLGLGVDPSFSAVSATATQCLAKAGLASAHLQRIVACLALAGASEPMQLSAAQAHLHPFATALITTDAQAACIGAHSARDGGVIITGTGSVAWAVVKDRTHRIGGWGPPISDEGSGAWVGGEALRRVLWAHDGRIAWTPVLRAIFGEFASDPHAVVRFVHRATPRDFASFAPHVFQFATRVDAVACELMKLGQRFHGSNHIRQPRRAYKTRCGRPDGD